MREILVAACLALFPVAAGAGNASATFMVSVVVAPSCEITADTLAFGSYAGETVTSSTAVTVACTSGVPYAVSLDSGQHRSRTTRNMAKGASTLQYELRKPTGEEWGDADYAGTYAPGTSVAGVGTGDPQRITVNGVLPAQGIKPPGEYTDLVQVIVHY
jgi:spore coat protein U-like protein